MSFQNKTAKELKNRLQKLKYTGSSFTKDKLIKVNEFTQKDVHQMRAIAKANNIKGYTKMGKRALVNNLIRKAPTSIFGLPPIVIPPIVIPPIPHLPSEKNVDVLFRYVYTEQDFKDKGDSYTNFFVRLILQRQQISGKVRVSFLIENLEDRFKDIVTTDTNEYDYHYNVPFMNKRAWFDTKHKFIDWWSPKSEISIFEYATRIQTVTENNVIVLGGYNKNVKCTLLITRDNTLSGDYIAQRFAEGINHCVFTPIINICDEKINSNTSIRTEQKYRNLKDKSIVLAKQYESGVPEEDLQKVCNRLNINININDLFNNELLRVKTTNAHPEMTLNYVNSKVNHVEFTKLLNKTADSLLTRTEIEDKFKQLKKDNQLFVFAGTQGSINMIIHNNIKYKCSTNYAIAEAKFFEETNLNLCAFDLKKDVELTEFLKMATHICTCMDYVPEFHKSSKQLLKDKKFKQIDQEKSYTQFKQVGEYYQGFLSVITNFNKVPEFTNMIDTRQFLYENVGIYQVCNIDTSNIKDINMLAHLQKLNIYKQYFDNSSDLDYGVETINRIEEIEKTVLPSPELIYLIDLGVTFKVIVGAYGVKPIDFEFPDYMKETENEKDPLRFYAKFTGKCMRVDDTSSLKVFCDQNTAKMVSGIYPDQVSYNNFFKELTLIKPKKVATSLTHIAAFITSYMRINMLNQLKEMDANKVLRVNMDGIYYEDHEFKINETFRDGFKDGIIRVPGNDSSSAYFFSAFEYPLEQTMKKEYIKGARVEARFAGGGCGKTHTELQRVDYTSLIFTTICNRLITAKKEEYKVNGITLKKLLCGSWIKYLPIYPANIVCDECTMMTNAEKEELIEKFPYSRIIFLGDIDRDNVIYQLPCVKGKRFNIDGIELIKDDYHTMHRCKCPKLKALITNIRNLMKIVSKNEDSDAEQMAIDRLKDHFGKYGMIQNRDDIAKLYDIKDYIITSVHENVNEWTDKFKGKFTEEKYYVNKNNQFHDNGNIIISTTKPLCSEIRHAFTIHSIQGQTCQTKLIIDMRKLFGGLQMIYTAISRAEYIDNIYIIY